MTTSPVPSETEAVQEALKRGHVQSVRRRVTIFTTASLLGVLVALISSLILFAGLQSQGQKVTDQGKQISTLATGQAKAAQAAQALQGQVKALGVTPVVTAPTVATTPATEEIQPTVSNAAVEQAVAAYLGTHPAANGAQVAAAVYSYCGQASLPCKGSTGSTGPSGSSGAVGDTGVQGASGPAGADGANATDAQVESAVDAYCSAHADCVGPAGPAGAQGAQGPAGPAGANGQPPSSWTYHDALGVEHTCTRSNTDDSAPTYACS